MNDTAVREVWERLARLDAAVAVLERKVEFLKGQVKARLKEEADARKL